MKRLLFFAFILFSISGICQPSFQLKGVVIDVANKIPVKGVRIHLIGPDGKDNVEETDATGHYSFSQDYFKMNTVYRIRVETSYVVTKVDYKPVDEDSINTGDYTESHIFNKSWVLQVVPKLPTVN